MCKINHVVLNLKSTRSKCKVLKLSHICPSVFLTTSCFRSSRAVHARINKSRRVRRLSVGNSANQTIDINDQAISSHQLPPNYLPLIAMKRLELINEGCIADARLRLRRLPERYRCVRSRLDIIVGVGGKTLLCRIYFSASIIILIVL